MWRSLKNLAEIRKQKRFILQRMEAAWAKLQGTDAWQDYRLYRKLMHSLELEEAAAMDVVRTQAATHVYSYMAENFPEEVDLAQDFGKCVEIQQELGHLIKVNTSLN